MEIRKIENIMREFNLCFPSFDSRPLLKSGVPDDDLVEAFGNNLPIRPESRSFNDDLPFLPE